MGKYMEINGKWRTPTRCYDPVNRFQGHPLQNGQFITDLDHSTLLSDMNTEPKVKTPAQNTRRNHGRNIQDKKTISTNSAFKTCTITVIFMVNLFNKIYCKMMFTLKLPLWPPYLLQLVTTGWSTPVILEESWETLSIGFHLLRAKHRNHVRQTTCATENLSLQQLKANCLTLLL